MKPNELIEAYVDDVVRHIDRKQRNDVGVELRALLGDELQALSDGAGRPADAQVTMDLLRRFGRPEDVAARYRKPGFAIIEAADAATFVKLSAIGMIGIWALGLVVTFRDGGGLERLGHWWMNWGLGAFWWPGFLVVCSGIASWVRRRFPVVDDWMPHAIDRDRINRWAWVLALAFWVPGLIWLTAPAQYAEDLTGGRLAREFYDSLAYDDGFRQVRLPILLTLMTIQLAFYAGIVAQGRWRKVTRRIDIALSTAITAVLVWSLAAGPVFRGEVSNEMTRGILALIVVIVVVDIGMKLYREMVRVKPLVLPS